MGPKILLSRGRETLNKGAEDLLLGFYGGKGGNTYVQLFLSNSYSQPPFKISEELLSRRCGILTWCPLGNNFVVALLSYYDG